MVHLPIRLYTLLLPFNKLELIIINVIVFIILVERWIQYLVKAVK